MLTNPPIRCGMGLWVSVSLFHTITMGPTKMLTNQTLVIGIIVILWFQYPWTKRALNFCFWEVPWKLKHFFEVFKASILTIIIVTNNWVILANSLLNLPMGRIYICEYLQTPGSFHTTLRECRPEVHCCSLCLTCLVTLLNNNNTL